MLQKTNFKKLRKILVIILLVVAICYGIASTWGFITGYVAFPSSEAIAEDYLDAIFKKDVDYS